jgi:DNA invertase Pin-like site-specific DNA recombinase
MNELLYSPKIKPEHLVRKAIVYLRQSSEKQVRQNIESQRLQYELAERVRSLGWQEIEVIKSDLGSSAAMGSASREGFERVLTSVALGEIGIVVSREVSRLSRTDKDWCRLFEVCQIFGTLIGDEQQVYDLSYLDDQLVLGIKGTLSVVELKVLRQHYKQDKSPKRAAASCSKGFRSDTRETEAARWCCILTGEFAKPFNWSTQNCASCGACARRSCGFVITMWSYRLTRSVERSWSGKFPRKAWSATFSAIRSTRELMFGAGARSRLY